MRERFHFRVGRRILPNGLKLLLMERPHLPVLSLTALVRSGVVGEAPEEAGLAAFTNGLLSRGTRRRDAVRLAGDIDGLGATLGVHSDYDFSVVAVSALARHAPQAVETLSEVLMEPAFAPEEVERRRSDILTFLERREDDAGGRVRNRFVEIVYGQHPYRHPREGYRETIAAVDRSGLQRFYDRFYRPNQTLVAVVGDFREEEMARRLADALGGWEPGDPGAPILPEMPEPSDVRIETIQKDGMTQATIRIGSLGIERRSPDYVPLVLLNYILGGSGFGSRLMRRLREERGLTYGVHSSFHPRRQRGTFFVVCKTGTGTMNEALAEIFSEITRLRREGVTEDELQRARRFFSGSLPLSLQTNDQLATRVLEQELFELEEEFWLRDIDRMESVTVETVNAMARRYLHPEIFTVVCLADFRGMELRVPSV